MTVLFAHILLAVLYLADPTTAERVDVAAEIVEAEDDGGANRLPTASASEQEKITITSDRSDFDRAEGVVLFEGHAAVDYSAGYRMGADRVFVFLAGSNGLDRIVALGHVSISNETRLGRCSMAAFRKKAGEIAMYGDPTNGPARLAEVGADEIAGAKITFWTDTEQVEIENSDITFGKGKGKVKRK